ncbi:cbb3-type cytochrome oxidase assembly protein CcoS [Henriciella pelagia]|jgi:cbb3-type cytochrome oxidase maturation protein|uniref:Cytochrome oxidase maturation protein, cbb3-type n=1 Tax=Henriciella pelagia TaxID=1977912 RepID=A0ABQ1JXV4_9PROT|nr:cbb3-type cytochrome oxidase assembly protein CcoS [Henriciella pelagia]GGB81197.1 cytochrome oxidase maturation protein, cbb3-type [Henriciella pelagia]
MEMLTFLIPVAILLGLTGLGAFIWAVRTGQFDDPQGDAARILTDNEDRPLPDRH